MSICYADINSDLDNYFNNLGFSSNTTSPHAYQGQQAGYYTGGSLNMRNQVRDVQIMQVSLPSYRSGCGGIDIFGGSFSMLNADELMELMQNILNNAGAYAFTLALETATPELENIMNKWNNYLNFVNQSNINSCEMAESLVGGMWPKTRGAQQRICEDIGTSNGTFADWAAAKQGCGVDGGIDKALSQAKKDGRYKDLVLDNGNIVWKAIQRHAFLQSDSELAELFMSLSGTVVLTKAGDGTIQNKTYPALVENNNLVKALLEGDKATIYRCDTTDTDGCLSPKDDKDIYISKDNAFKSHVAKLLRSMADKIMTDKALSDEEIGLLQSTSLPIYKMLNVQAAYMKDGNLPDVDQYADVIALDILYQYLHESLSLIKQSVAVLPYPDSILEKIEPGIEQEMRNLVSERKNAYSELVTTTQLIEETQAIERMLTGEFSSEFASTISWAKGLR